MKKFTWLFIILTLIVWLAIARYWTGTSSVNPRPAPASSTSIMIEAPTPTPSVIASDSAAIQEKGVTATPSTDLKY